MTSEPVPLSVLGLDYPEPVTGWAAELARRGIRVVEDDLGRPAIARGAAQHLLTEQRQLREAAARKQAEAERRAVEASEAFRASLPAGIPWHEVPVGVDPAVMMMASDPMDQRRRRESVLQHALSNGGEPVYHSLAPDGGDQ